MNVQQGRAQTTQAQQASKQQHLDRLMDEKLKVKDWCVICKGGNKGVQRGA